MYMFVRSLTIFGAVAAFLAVNSADADAFGRYHGGGKYMTCYKKVVTPPVYRTVTERVMVTPATCSQYRTPPTYGTTAYEVVVQPSTQVVHSKRAVYGRVQVTRQVRPAHTRWVRNRCHGGNYKCAVTTPPKYRTHSKRVMIQPRTAWVETRPAVKRVVHRQVMLDPGKVRQVCQPAVYQTVTRQVMVSPGTEHWVPALNTAYPATTRQPVQTYNPQPRGSGGYRPAKQYGNMYQGQPLK